MSRRELVSLQNCCSSCCAEALTSVRFLHVGIKVARSKSVRPNVAEEQIGLYVSETELLRLAKHPHRRLSIV